MKALHSLVAATVLLASLAVPVRAADAQPNPARMINFATVLTDQDDQPYLDCTKLLTPNQCMKDKDTPMTLGRLALGALTKPEANALPEDSVRRTVLAIRLYKALEPIELDTKEIEAIKTAIGKTLTGPQPMPAVMVMKAYEILDPASVKPAR